MQSLRFNSLVLIALLPLVIMSYQSCSALKALPKDETFDLASKNLFMCSESSPPPVSTEMKRLTHRELTLVLTDIFGSQIVSAVSKHIDLFPIDVLTDPAETFVRDHSKDHVSAAFYVADALGVALAVNRSPLERFTGTCIISQTPSDTCVSSLIQGLGSQVFRRPLTKGSPSAEVEQLLAAYKGESSPANGLKLLISQIMLAPNFWFHLEGSGVIGEKGVRLTPYEVASRISFKVTGSMPDAELFAAAHSGQLSNQSQVRKQVERLMKTQRGKQQILLFLSNWLLLNKSPELSEVPQYLNGISSQGLAKEMAEELQKFVEHVVFTEQGKFSDLFLNASMFAKSTRLAAIYQTPTWTEGSKPATSSGPYKGIILRGSFLLDEGEKSSPIHRGVFLRRRILCDNLPTPPNDVIVQRTGVDPDPIEFSNRMRTHLITKAVQCAACHSRINPIGFIFENFDSLGRWRNVEKVYSESGTVVAQHSIDTSVVIESVNTNKPLVTASPEDLNEELSKSDVASACLSQRYFRHLNLRHEKSEQVADNCRLHSMQNKLNGSTLFDFFAESVANDSIFYRSM